MRGRLFVEAFITREASIVAGWGQLKVVQWSTEGGKASDRAKSGQHGMACRVQQTRQKGRSSEMMLNRKGFVALPYMSEKIPNLACRGCAWR